jgi:hypothetical protein
MQRARNLLDQNGVLGDGKGVLADRLAISMSAGEGSSKSSRRPESMRCQARGGGGWVVPWHVGALLAMARYKFGRRKSRCNLAHTAWRWQLTR